MYTKVIFVVNDDPNISMAIAELLKARGFENVSVFKDGREVLERIKTVIPDLIISDINMPGIDGYQLCKILKSNESGIHKNIPVILASATYRDAVAEKLAFESGANAFLQVPYNPDDLITLVYASLIPQGEGKPKGLPYKAKRKVLVADDDPSILNALKFFLNEEGYEVITADDGETAIELFKTGKPQLSFLDYQMPKKDGIEVLKWVRENHPETGVVMMTAFGTESKAVEMMKAGADDYIKKPFDIKAIPAICERIFNRYNIRLIDRQFKEKALEREMMMEQLIQAEKLSSIGTLVSGIAHELNNPLTGVIGYTEILMSDAKLPAAVKTDLEKIYREANRCVRIVQNLLTFARRYKAEKGAININEILQGAIDLISYQFKVNNIQLITDFDKIIPSIYGDPQQLQQAFLNIIINAYQAMYNYKKCGTLTIKTKIVGDASTVPQYIRVSFKNDGPPIPEEHKFKIFDPFFTTKGVGKGTGLGLSITHGIVKDHGGSITAENIADSTGSHEAVVFTVTLPVTKALEKGKEAAETIHRKVTGKKILIVEDEDSIRDLMKRFIERDGHTVKLSSNGMGAIEEIKKNDFDLIISDLKMPDIDGITLYERAIKIKPELQRRFVIFTGTIDTDVIAFAERTGNRYLQKPFKHTDLKKLLEEIFQE
ncbi:MAG: response regulator [Nitrospinae bacterium]|nr:response regulator [Nitrospinota bacterium]